MMKTLKEWLIRNKSTLGALCLGASLILASPLAAAKRPEALDVPPETLSRLWDDLTNDSYQQPSFILHYGLIESVQFNGMTGKSRVGYSRESEHGLWLVLKAQGGSSFANVTIRFKGPRNMSRYNSVVLWVRAHSPESRLWVGAQDAQWQTPDDLQGRSGVLPKEGFPADEISRLVVPFEAISAGSSINFRTLRQIQIEFGQDTVGNSGDLDILGIAFANQAHPISEPRLFRPFLAPPQAIQLPVAAPRPFVQRKNKVPTQTARVVSVPARPVPALPNDLSRQSPREKPPVVPAAMPQPAVKIPEKPMVAAILMPRPAAATEKMAIITGPSLPSVPKPVALAVQPPKPGAPQVVHHPKSHHVLPKSKPPLFWVGNSVQALEMKLSGFRIAHPAFFRTSWRINPRTKILFNHWFRASRRYFGAGLILLLAGELWILRRRRTSGSPFAPKLRKVLFETTGPNSPNRPKSRRKMDRQFWKEVSAVGTRRAWLSPFKIRIKRRADEQHYGEGFLRRQIEISRRAGVELFPSLSFAQTIFHEKLFFSNPGLYHIRPLAVADRILSDQALQAKHPAYFLLKLTPSEQKEHHLPERLLAAYGKLGRARGFDDSIQYNFSSPDLRELAISCIDQFAKIAKGVRIQGSALLLAGGHSPKSGASRSNGAEFWFGVIAKVRASHPDLVMIADRGGEDVERLLEAGFDYVENNRLAEALVQEIRAGQLENLPRLLGPESHKTLHHSVFDISPLGQTAQGAKAADRAPDRLAALILTLLPGLVQYEEQVPGEIAQFINWACRINVFDLGRFALLEAGSPHVLAFARWTTQSIYFVAANLSSSAVETNLQLGSLASEFDSDQLYLVSDALHGLPFRILPTESKEDPAVALLGSDIKQSGFPVSISPKKMRIFSIDLKTSISKSLFRKIKKIYRT